MKFNLEEKVKARGSGWISNGVIIARLVHPSTDLLWEYFIKVPYHTNKNNSLRVTLTGKTDLYQFSLGGGDILDWEGAMEEDISSLEEKQIIIPTKKIIDGMTCCGCGNFSPMAEANWGTNFACFGCRSTRTWRLPKL